jgi:alkyl hydroperoxide reductase subunit AhpC
MNINLKTKTFQEILDEKTIDYEIHWKFCEPTEEQYMTLEDVKKEIKRLEDIIDEQDKETDRLVGIINDRGKGW